MIGIATHTARRVNLHAVSDAILGMMEIPKCNLEIESFPRKLLTSSQNKIQ